MNEVNVLAAATRTAPAMDWSVDPSLQSACSKVAFVLMAAWLGYILVQYVKPGRGGGNRMQWGKLIWVGLACIILMDLDLVQTIVNSLLEGVWWLGGLVGLT